eukprot:s1115_g2.t1
MEVLIKAKGRPLHMRVEDALQTLFGFMGSGVGTVLGTVLSPFQKMATRGAMSYAGRFARQTLNKDIEKVEKWLHYVMASFVLDHDEAPKKYCNKASSLSIGSAKVDYGKCFLSLAYPDGVPLWEGRYMHMCPVYSYSDGKGNDFNISLMVKVRRDRELAVEVRQCPLRSGARGFTGPPMKSISKGVPVVSGKEGRTTSQANKDLAWEQSHAALGIEGASKNQPRQIMTTRRGYCHACDVWAAGITMYMVMFAGKHPFITASQQLDQQALMVGQLDFSISSGFLGFAMPKDRYSQTARVFCRQMVTVDFPRRITAVEARQSIWFQVLVIMITTMA